MDLKLKLQRLEMVRCRNVPAKGNLKAMVIFGMLTMFVVLSYYLKDAYVVEPSKKPGRVDILINTYMRSGSSFLGRMLSSGNDTFYFYEPLWKLMTWKYMQSSKRDHLCGYKTTECQTVPGVTTKAFSLIDDIYNCRLANNVELYQVGMQTAEKFAGPNWKIYQDCKKKETDLTHCWKKVEEFCSKSPYRVTKILRMDMNYTEVLLRNNSYLKVIKLFRDPRSVISSHLFTKWFPLRLQGNTKDISEDIGRICFRMKEDLEAGQRLLRTYPGRVVFVQYEDLIEDPLRKIKKLFTYVGKDAHTLITDNNELTYTGSIQFSYRQKLPYYIVKEIDAHCGDELKALGYNTFPSEGHLHDPEFSPITKPLPYAL